MALPSQLVVTKPADIGRVRPVPGTPECSRVLAVLSSCRLIRLALTSLRCQETRREVCRASGPWAPPETWAVSGPLLAHVCRSGPPRQVQGTTSLCRSVRD